LQFSPFSYYFVCLMSKYSSEHLVPGRRHSVSFSGTRFQVSNPYRPKCLLNVRSWKAENYPPEQIPYFKGTEGWLLRLQKSAYRPYFESAESSLSVTHVFSKTYVILYSRVRLRSPRGLFPPQAVYSENVNCLCVLCTKCAKGKTLVHVSACLSVRMTG
jgi:hypothetical protein